MFRRMRFEVAAIMMERGVRFGALIVRMRHGGTICLADWLINKVQAIRLVLPLLGLILAGLKLSVIQLV